MKKIIIKELDNNNLKKSTDTNSFILLHYDSFGNISNMHNLLEIFNKNEIEELEEIIKNKINSYKFKTLQSRNYLPIGTSIYIIVNNINIIYSPIMWVNQDISNTNNIFYAMSSCLSHIYKISCITNNHSTKYLYVHKFPTIKTIEDEQISKALDYIQDIFDKDREHFIQSLDYKEDLTIFSGESNTSEQPPIYQNNEFRELTYT